MAITRQYNLNPNAAGNAAFAAGRGEYEKYLDDLALRQRQVAQGDERLRQTQQQLEIERQTVEQRERMQQRSLAFQDVSQQRQIRESDQDRRERLANANRQLAFSEINRNRQIEFQQAQQNARTDFSTRAGIYGQQLGIAADQQRQAQQIAAQQQQQVLGAQLQARSRQQQAVIQGQLQQQRAGLDAMARQQSARLGVESAYATSPLQAQQQQMQQNAQLLQQGYGYSAEQQPVVSKLRGEIQQIQSSNLPPAIAQREIAKRQQGIAQITPEEKPAQMRVQEEWKANHVPVDGGWAIPNPKTGGWDFKPNPVDSTTRRNEHAERLEKMKLEAQREQKLLEIQLEERNRTFLDLSPSDIYSGAQKLMGDPERADAPSFGQAAQQFTENMRTAQQQLAVAEAKNRLESLMQSPSPPVRDAARTILMFGPDRDSLRRTMQQSPMRRQTVLDALAVLREAE